MKKYVYEFIGTFFLVFTVGMTVLNPNGVGYLAPLAIGSVLAVMVFAGAHVSGGHYNPAVSFAIFLRGKMKWQDMWIYWLVQLIGGVVAAFLTIYFKGSPAQMPLEPSPWQALIAEFLFTFALCFVVLNVMTAKETKGNAFFGFAVGFTILVGAYAVGSISGAAFNPAVALGITIMNLSLWANFWILVVGSLLGGLVAAIVFKASHGKE
jgi:aquaporin Z